MGEGDTSDERRIRACLRGETTAWRELVDRYGRLVYSVATRYGLGPADADDVFQAVFVSLHVRLSELRCAASLPAWLVVAARRECWRRRKRRDAPTATDLAACEATSNGVDDELLLLERQHALRAGLRELGGPCAALLSLLFLTDQRPSYEEIAEQLELPVGSIGPTRARCFEKLEWILRKSGLFDDR